MNLDKKPEWLTPDWPAPAKVKALSTLRYGGYSLSPYDELNLGAFVGDDPNTVLANRKLLKETAKLPAEPLWLKQVHGTRVINLDFMIEPQNLEADASVSFKSNLVCAVTTADCLPLLLCDVQGTRVAAVHAGWRGLAAGVIESAVHSLNCSADKLLAWLGPALGPENFEVGQDVRSLYQVEGDEQAFVPLNESLKSLDPHQKKWNFNIYRAAISRLNRLGVTKIYGGDFCTYADKTRFYSYRRSTHRDPGGVTGRMASLIWLD